MKIKVINNPLEFMKELNNVLAHSGAICHRASTPLVHVGVDAEFNEEYCINNNIPIFRVERVGGTIVSNVGDFDFVIVDPNIEKDVRIPPEVLQKLFVLANDHELDVVFDGNDLLIDGYKTASYSNRQVDGGIYTAIHISMSVNMELIQNICTKEMKKIPKGLNDFGITNEEVEECLFK